MAGRQKPGSWAGTRFSALRAEFQRAAQPEHAAFHQAYHKSKLSFYGLRAPEFELIFRTVFPKREGLVQTEALALVESLWASAWAEERWAAIALLERLVPQLGADELVLLKRIADGCDGWGVTDMFSLRVLGPLALRLDDRLYAPVRAWSDEPHLWTRRCSILIHCVPARQSKLAQNYAWDTFEERLLEKEFFIRKAIGWALRECGKHYPQEVCDFLLRTGERASGLTRREGARNLPAPLRLAVLGR